MIAQISSASSSASMQERASPAALSEGSAICGQSAPEIADPQVSDRTFSLS